MDKVEKDKRVIDLQNWLRKNGMDQVDLKSAIFEGIGRGLMAMRDFQGGGLVIAVPEHLLISTKTALKSDLGEVVRRYPNKLTPLQLLCAFFINESIKEKQSFWSPYLEALPRCFDTPAYFSTNELSYLPLSLKQKAAEHEDILKKNYKKLKMFFTFAKRTNLTYEMFLWAWFVINTRTLYQEQERNSLFELTEKDCYIMAPYLDLLNHAPLVEVQGAFNSKTKCYEIYTQTLIEKSKQVFIHYGPHDNSTLLLEYGFILPENPHNIVQFNKDRLIQICQSQRFKALTREEDKKQFLSLWKQKLKLADDNALTDLSCSKDGLSWHLECFLGILALNDKEVKDESWKEVILGNLTTETRKWQNYFAGKVLEIHNKESEEALQVITRLSEQSYHIQMVAQLRMEEVDMLRSSLATIEETQPGGF